MCGFGVFYGMLNIKKCRFTHSARAKWWSVVGWWICWSGWLYTASVFRFDSMTHNILSFLISMTQFLKLNADSKIWKSAAATLTFITYTSRNTLSITLQLKVHDNNALISILCCSCDYQQRILLYPCHFMPIHYSYECTTVSTTVFQDLLLRGFRCKNRVSDF